MDHTSIIQIDQRKKKIYRSLVKNGFENKVKFACYKRYRNQVTRLLVLSKKEYYQSQFLIARNDSEKTWKLINTLLPGRTKATSTPPNLTHPLSGECKQNPADIANILNDFFVSVGKNMASKIIPPPSNKTHIAKMNCESSFYLHETSAEEIMHIIVLRSEIPSSMCAKLRTVAASNNRDHARNLSYYCLLALHTLWCYSSRTSCSW